ncbi:hypothetical protein B0H10DRAFT_2087381 [Mycena sp. CBHHK59/15]|nr:hypothetical protein B0H10DRAFT_2087381 [Mycena sp. CBHHK59/15]
MYDTEADDLIIPILGAMPRLGGLHVAAELPYLKEIMRLLCNSSSFLPDIQRMSLSI